MNYAGGREKSLIPYKIGLYWIYPEGIEPGFCFSMLINPRKSVIPNSLFCMRQYLAYYTVRATWAL